MVWWEIVHKARHLLIHFKWGEVDAYFIESTSKAHDLREHYASVVTLSAAEVTAYWAGINHLRFSNGYYVFGRLFSSSTFLVTTEGLKGRGVGFCSAETIDAKLLAKRVRAIAFTKPKLDEDSQVAAFFKCGRFIWMTSLHWITLSPSVSWIHNCGYVYRTWLHNCSWSIRTSQDFAEL